MPFYVKFREKSPRAVAALFILPPTVLAVKIERAFLARSLFFLAAEGGGRHGV